MALDVLRVGLSAVLVAAAAVVLVIGTLYPARVVVTIPRLRTLGQPDALESTAAFCPIYTILLLGMVTVVWDKRLYLPQPEYYSLAAQVIPIALIALVIEGAVLAAFTRLTRACYGLLFVAGEIAAFIAASGSIRGSHDFRVGGSKAWSGVLASFTTAALVAAAVLTAAAVVSRASTQTEIV
jgi:hypothetical protein